MSEDKTELTDKESTTDEVVQGNAVPPSGTPKAEASALDLETKAANAAVDEPEEIIIEHPDPDMKWYIVHTQSGFEAKAKQQLEENVRMKGLEAEFGSVLIPVESVVELVKGKKKSSERKFFPGYILVQMKLTDENWHIVKDTHRITGFVGHARKPPALPIDEVKRVTAQMREGLTKARPKFTFKEGDSVRVIDGPFSNFNGTVEEVKPEKSKIRVLVSIFGRATPVELDFIQVEKT